MRQHSIFILLVVLIACSAPTGRVKTEIGTEVQPCISMQSHKIRTLNMEVKDILDAMGASLDDVISRHFRSLSYGSVVLTKSASIPGLIAREDNTVYYDRISIGFGLQSPEGNMAFLLGFESSKANLDRDQLASNVIDDLIKHGWINDSNEDSQTSVRKKLGNQEWQLSIHPDYHSDGRPGFYIGIIVETVPIEIEKGLDSAKTSDCKNTREELRRITRGLNLPIELSQEWRLMYHRLLEAHFRPIRCVMDRVVLHVDSSAILSNMFFEFEADSEGKVISIRGMTEGLSDCEKHKKAYRSFAKAFTGEDSIEVSVQDAGILARTQRATSGGTPFSVGVVTIIPDQQQEGSERQGHLPDLMLGMDLLK